MPLLSIYIWRTTSSFRRMWLCCYNWMTTNNEVLLTFYLYFYPCRTEGERTKMGFALNKAMRSGKSFELRYIFGKMYSLSWKKYQIFRYIFDTYQKAKNWPFLVCFAKNFDYWNQGNYTGHFSTVKIPVWSKYRESQKAENFQKTHGLST